jgi:DhnA family fructose-bisphosphate aldolase class Ia
MMATYKRRLARILREDGRALIVAMDHGSQGPVAGLEDPGCVLDEVVEAGADAILTSFGIATAFAGKFERCGLILRIDGGSGFGTEQVRVWQRYHVADAVTIGADGVGCMGLIGWPCEAENLRYMTQLTSECLHTGMPLMVESMPFSDTAPGPDHAAGVAKGARMAAEFGADLVKTVYTGDADSFRAVVESTFVPIVILGGPKVDSDAQLLETVHEALGAGAAGVAFGRNIWRHRTPGNLVRALAALIHDGAGPEQAAKWLE